jgi:hypothetical protein
MTIWRMICASWMTETTDTHSEYVKRIAFPRQQIGERASILRLYVRCLSCFSVKPGGTYNNH